MSRFAICLSTAALLVLGSGRLSVAENINMVEEDWELDVSVPNANKSTPQINCVMSPLADISSVYAIFDLNQRSSSGEAGGLEVQIWNNNTLLAVGSFSGTSSLGTTGEKVQWTQRMSVSDGVLTFEILDGTSQTWGKFPGKKELIASASVSLTNLNGYDPNVTAKYSDVDYGNQRVERLILKKVRTYADGKKNVEKALDRVVYPQ